MNKMVAVMLAGALVLGLVSIVVAADSATADMLRGKVVKVDGVNLTVKTGRGDAAKEVVVITDDKTAVTLDGKAAKVADLKEGNWVRVTPVTGTATKIEAFTKRPTKSGTPAASR
jgi:hypothetical protein